MRKSRKFIAIVMAITILITSFSGPVYAEGNFNQGLESGQETVLLDEKGEDLLSDQALNNDSLEEIPDETKEIVPDIICEVEELRGENYKQFLLSDESYMIAMYNEPIHQEQDGVWKDIDNSLTISTAKESEDFEGLENKNNNKFKVKFAKKSTSNKLLTIKNGDSVISWSSVKEIKKSKKVKDNTSKKKDNSIDGVNNSTTENGIIDNQAVETTEQTGDLEDIEDVKEVSQPTIDSIQELTISSEQTEETSQSITDINALATEPILEYNAVDVSTSKKSLVEEYTVEENNTEKLTTEEATFEESIKEEVNTEELTTQDLITESINAEELNKQESNIQLETEEIQSNEVMLKEVKPDEMEDVQENKNEEFLKLENLKSEVRYENILPNIDLQYILAGTELKENIIIKEKSDSYDIAFELSLKKLSIKQNSDGSIDIIKTNKKSQEEVVFKIPAPFMYDSNGVYSDNVHYLIEEGKKKDSYIFHIVADEEWINSEERGFPVTIDPIISLNKSGNLIEDACVGQSGNKTTAQVIGRQNNSTYRIFVKPTSLPQLDKGDVVVKAEFIAPVENGSSNLKALAYKVDTSWSNSTITWANQPSIYSVYPIDYSDLPQSGLTGSMKFDITKLVREWYSGKVNNGIMIKASDESQNIPIYMKSTTATGSAYSFNPTFSIIYRNNKGLENYWDFHTIGTGDAGASYINRYTGNLVFIHDDLVMNGSRMPIDLYHVYSTDMAGKKFDNTNARTRSYINLNVGFGFKLNLQQTLIESPTISNSYIYVDGDGTEHSFTGTEVMDEDGLGYQLSKNVSSNECTLTDKHKNKMLFSSAGYLRTITDSNNNVLTIYYDAGSTLISSVIDGAGRKTTFTYNSKKYLSKITDPSGRSTTYSYSSTYNGPISSEEGGFLRTVTYPDGTSTNYTYYSDGTMETAKNSNNIGVQFQYTSDASKRVAKVTEMSGTKAGKNIKFSYLSDGRTTCQATGVDGIMDTSDDLITTYCFDVMGHLTSTYSENINKTAFYDAYAYEYDPDALGTQPINPGNVNKIMKSSKGYKAIPNELLNHSAETDSSWFTINPVSSISYSASRATDCVYIGKSSLKLKVDQATNEKLVMKQEKRELPYGATYTYSAYVNTNDIVASAGDGGAGIYVETVTHTGIKTRKYAEFVTGTTDKNINNGWRKIQVTFTIPQYFYYAELGVELRYAKGTAWFDAMQLEKEETSSAYNLLENSGFENGAWSTLSLTKGQIYTSGAKEGVKCFRFEGNYINKNRISQTVEINKSGTQSYVLSGWAKASSAQSGGNKKFALGATVRYTDGTTKTDELKFNPYNTDWQYVTGAIFPDPAKTVSNITIEAIYDYNVGEACFDSIALVSDLSSTSYTYDAKGNLLSTSQTSKTTYSYTNDNNISKIISPSGYNYQYTYDDKNNLTSVTSEAGVKSDLTYDTYGNPLSVKTGNIINTATYFDGNYLSTIKDTRGKTTYYNYDPTKGLLLNKMDANGIITRYTYDSATDNQISSYIDIDRNGQANAQDPKYSLVYANKRLKTINHNNFNYNLDYNEFGEILSINVNSTKLINYIYKGDNRKRQIVNYYGVSLEYAYDNLFRIISKRYNGNIIYEWKYDTQGNIYKLIDNANKITYNFEYDNGGRLIRQISYSGLNYEIGYDIENRVNKLSYQFGKEPSKTQKITYGQDNRIQSLTLLNNLGTSYNYDSIGRVTSQSLNLNSQGTNKITQNYTYLAGVGTNSTYMVESIEYNKTIGGATSLTGSKLTYTYDALGNIETISEGGVLKLKYYYDNLNQLIKEEDYRINAITTYSYDLGGNIQSKAITYAKGVPKTYTYGYDGTWKDLLTSFDGKAITYNATGSPISYLGSTLKWEYGRSLSKYTYGATTIDFKYDVNGNRTSKDVIASGVSTVSKFYYEGDKLVRQQTGNNTMWFLHDENGNAVGIEYNGATYYYQRNLQGDIIRIIDTNGNVVASYVYDSWGKIISSSDANGIGKINPLRYRGYYYDEETGWYYLQSRYYNPEVGRFLNADDVGVLGKEQGNVLQHNLFSYCYNNPIMYSDPSGYFVIAIPFVAYLLMDAAVTVMVLKEGYDFYNQVTNAKKNDKKEDAKKKEESKKEDSKKTDDLGDVNTKDLKPLPKNKIKELGGEEYTQGVKKEAGRSKSNLYWNPKTGDVYTIPRSGGAPQFVDTLPI